MFHQVIKSLFLCDDNYIAPVFSYADHTSIIVPTQGSSTYVPYQLVQDNEFFAELEAALSIWERLKEQMLSAYPSRG